MMLIDDRENETLKYHDWGIPHQIKRLKTADYIICENVVDADSGETGLQIGDSLLTGHVIGIEAKEINDFVGSMNQRLWEQLANMEENFETSVLMVYGHTGDLNHRNMEPRKIEGIYGAISRITVSYDVSVIWVRERTQFIKLLKKIHDKGGTKRAAEKAHLTKRSFRDDRVDVLYGIHGLGYQKIKDLLEEFGSVRAIANASPDQLSKVKGVGPKTAEKIHSIMTDGEKSSLL